MIRLGVVDDHPAIAEAIARRAESAGDVVVAAVARTAADGAALLRSADLDVVILDLDLGPGPSGLELLSLVGRRPAVIVVSATRTPSLVRAAIELGASGYLVKTADVDEILLAARTVIAGGTWYRTADLQASASAPRPPSGRELGVLDLIVGGLTNDEVGLRLGLSVKTIESHLRRLFDRYGVASRTELAVLALREGWVGSGGTGLEPPDRP
ncbi:MAG TPA: response regulator transcription factor [Candidatus Limnocylindrales bacterium]